MTCILLCISLVNRAVKVTFYFCGSKKSLGQLSLPLPTHTPLPTPAKWLGWGCGFEKSKWETAYLFDKYLLNTYCVFKSCPMIWEDSLVHMMGPFPKKRWKLCLMFPPRFYRKVFLEALSKGYFISKSYELFWERKSCWLTWFSLGFQIPEPQISYHNIVPSQVRPTGVTCPWDRHQLSPFLRVLESLLLLHCPLLLGDQND